MAGKGKADGGRSGTVRNPEHFCSRPGCEQYAMKNGGGVCKVHGGQLPSVKRAAARRTFTQDVVKRGDLQPKDFPKAVCDLVAWHISLVKDIQAELDTILMVTPATEVSREYADVLDRVEKSSASVAKLMNSVAALGIADAFQQQAQAMTESERRERVNRLLALTLEAAPTGPMWECPTCGRGCCSQSSIEDAEVVEP